MKHFLSFHPVAVTILSYVFLHGERLGKFHSHGLTLPERCAFFNLVKPTLSGIVFYKSYRTYIDSCNHCDGVTTGLQDSFITQKTPFCLFVKSHPPPHSYLYQPLMYSPSPGLSRS